MPQVFHPSTNTLSRVSLLVLALGVGAFFAGMFRIYRSSYETGEEEEVPQPVQFSHRHHVADDGIDCRYCHSSVETSSFAGIPATSVCMNCHSQIYRDSEYLRPVFESYRTGMPIRWNRVHRLADFAYFDHSIHIQKGVGCSTCHGRVDEMALMRPVVRLQMNWCLDCHRNPQAVLRPPEKIFQMDWTPPANQAEEGRRLAAFYHIADTALLTSCSTCHR